MDFFLTVVTAFCIYGLGVAAGFFGHAARHPFNVCDVCNQSLDKPLDLENKD